MAELTDDAILAELGIDLAPKPVKARTPREERIIAGFEDIAKFRDEHGRAPRHGAQGDIFERLYAVRLDRLRALPEARHLLAGIDVHGLLDGTSVAPAADALDDDALLSELGVDTPVDDISHLRNVRANSERSAAEEVAGAKRCDDFATFKPLFARVRSELEAGIRTTRPFVRDLGMSKAEIQPGEFFILGGQTAYVAELGEPIKAPNGQTDARLRVIYANGTESDLLLRSLQRALYKDEGGRRISEPTAGPLFASSETAIQTEPDLLATGTLYVLRSRSTHPTVAAHRELVHKIGITGGSVEARIAGAADDATYLLAGVDVVATYKLYEVNRPRLEALIHRVLDGVRFDVELPDRFGKLVRPREWFLVPLPIIDEIVRRIGDGSLVDMTYDQGVAALVPA